MIPSLRCASRYFPFLALLALAGTVGAGEPNPSHAQPLVIRTGQSMAPTTPAPQVADASKRPEKNEVQGLLKLGTGLTDRGDFDSAEIAFRQVLAVEGVSAEDTKNALLGLARLFRKQGSSVKAIAIYEKYLKEFPGDERTPDVLLEAGRTLRAMGSHRLALARFYSVINSTLKLPDRGFEHYQQLAKTAQFEIAETHFEAGNYADAAKFYARLRLLDLAPADRARAHFKAACALKLQGDNEGAVTMLSSYLEQWPDDENVPEARYLLATTLRARGLPQEALAVTLDLLRSEQAQDAKDPKRWSYWQRRTGNQLANEFFEHGDILNAQAIYTGLANLSEDPTWRLPVIYQIALCNERLGSLDQARAAYTDIIAATKTKVPPELAELGRMAAWRLAHLDWNSNMRQQVTTLFETTTGRPRPVTPPAKTPAPL